MKPATRARSARVLAQLEPAVRRSPRCSSTRPRPPSGRCLAHAEPKRPTASEALLDQRAPAFRVAEQTDAGRPGDSGSIGDPPLVAGATDTDRGSSRSRSMPSSVRPPLMRVELARQRQQPARSPYGSPSARSSSAPKRRTPSNGLSATQKPSSATAIRAASSTSSSNAQSIADAKVLLFGDRDVMPLSSVNLDRLVGHPEGLRELEKEPRVPPPKQSFVARLAEPLRCKLSDRLEHPVALVRETEQALLDERLQGVEVGVRHLFRGLESAAAGEDREAREQPLLVPDEEVVAPLDRRA